MIKNKYVTNLIKQIKIKNIVKFVGQSRYVSNRITKNYKNFIYYNTYKISLNYILYIFS